MTKAAQGVWLIGAALVAMTLAGCGDSDDRVVEVSDECSDLFRRASESNDEAVYGPLFDDSLEECRTVAEWTAGLRQFPGAIGLKGPEFVDGRIELGAVCTARVARTPVCSEAIKEELIPDPGDESASMPTSTKMAPAEAERRSEFLSGVRAEAPHIPDDDYDLMLSIELACDGFDLRVPANRDQAMAAAFPPLQEWEDAEPVLRVGVPIMCPQHTEDVMEALG